MVARGGLAWLALQHPSKFKIQDEYIESGDQILYIALSMWTIFIIWVDYSGLEIDWALVN